MPARPADTATIPDDLLRCDPRVRSKTTVIQKGHSPTGERSWVTRFRKLDIKRAEPRGLILGDMGLCLTAAVEGAGVAIARSLLVADAIADGRLVPTLASQPDVLSTKVHVARWSPALICDQSIKALVDWMTQAAEQTNSDVLETVLR